MKIIDARKKQKQKKVSANQISSQFKAVARGKTFGDLN